MKFISSTMLACLLLVSQCWPSDAVYSLRIQKLLKEARAAEATGRNWPIGFVTSSDTRQFLGFTNYTEDRRIEINIPPLTSPDYDDSLKAHELTHVILNARGFAGVFFGEFGQYVAPNVADLFDGARAWRPLIHDAAIGLNFCFSDELIDRETRKRGFNPNLLLQKETAGRLLGFASLQASYESQPDIEKRHQALQDFCFLKRLSNAPNLRVSMLKYETATQSKMGPSIDMLRKRLLETFEGKRCEITKPEPCFPLTLQLRGAAGLKNVILLPKPQTWKPE